MGKLTLDEIRAVVRGWFYDPFDSMGYRAVPEPWGTYWGHGRVCVAGLTPDEVPEFVADLRLRFGDGEQWVGVWLDNEADVELAGPALIEHGFNPPVKAIFLAHTDAAWRGEITAGISVSKVTGSNLVEFAQTKIRAWKGDESEPDAEAIEAEVGRRRKELSGSGRGLIGTKGSGAAGFIWWHEDDSQIQWITQLATRLPYRRQGVAQSLLASCIETSYEEGQRGLVLDVDVTNHPARQLYQKMGFRDHVYTSWEYEMVPGA